VFETLFFPPKAKADVLLTPAPPPSLPEVFKSLTSVQLVPFQDSVSAVNVFVPGGISPPNANTDVLSAPAEPTNPPFAVFKSLTSVHAVPFQDSVLSITVCTPPKAKADVELPVPPKNVSQCLNHLILPKLFHYIIL